VVAKTSVRWRQAAVWMHVITSVGWMSQVLVVFALLTVSFTSAEATMRVSATSMAQVLDTFLLAPLGNASAFTGFMLAASTSWGFFRHWWILAKFGITVVQLNVAVFVLSKALDGAGAAAEAGAPAPTAWLIVGTGLMASAIAFQAWLSVSKPWQRTPWTAGSGRRAPKLVTAANGYFVATVIAPLSDIAVGLVMGFPSPLCQLLVLATRLIARPRQQPVPAKAATVSQA
jgi:hypothetical protein